MAESGTDEDLTILDEQPAIVCWFLPETEGRAVEDIIRHFGDRGEPSRPERGPRPQNIACGAARAQHATPGLVNSFCPRSSARSRPKLTVG